MNLAIEFDGESFGRTIEIENVASYTMLSSEFSPIEP